MSQFPQTLPSGGQTSAESRRPRVVVVGGGFAGLNAARSLGTLPVDVTLIDRRNHPTDRRRHLLYLTKIGRRALKRIGALTVQLERLLLAALKEKEKQGLFDVLTRIVSQQQMTPSVHPAYRQFGKR